MKKEVFVSLLEHVKKEYDMAMGISDEINEVFHKNGRPLMEHTDLSELVFSYEFMDEFVEILKKEFDDTEDVIGTFIYENDWGSVAEDGEPKTIGDLYDTLSGISKNEYSGMCLMLENYEVAHEGCFMRGMTYPLNVLKSYGVPSGIYKELTKYELSGNGDGIGFYGKVKNILDDYDNGLMF
jgi:hypothetical protein